MSAMALVEQLRTIDDPRRRNANLLHPLENVLAIGFCGIVCGAEAFTEMEEFGHAKRAFFERFLDLTNGIPTHDTFGRVFALLPPPTLLPCLSAWLQARRGSGTTAGRPVNVDGKTVRGPSLVQLVSAWAGDEGIVLGQQAVAAGSNEVAAIGHLLALLELEGAVVTIDAAGCQKAIAAQIVEQKADYVLALKRNHPTLHAQVSDRFLAATEAGDPALRHVRRTETSHGRREARDYYVLALPPGLHEAEQWAGLRSLGMVVRQWQDLASGKESGDVRYFLSSLPPRVQRLAESVRSHWGIENQLHWVLDVAFHEDDCRIQNPTAAANVAALNRLALAALKADRRVKRGIATKRKVAGWKDDYLLALLHQAAES